MILPILLLILISPLLALAFAHPTTTTRSLITTSASLPLCYDTRHASHRPPLLDCVATINTVLTRYHRPLSQFLTFSHHPSSSSSPSPSSSTQQRLPIRFHYPHRRDGGCVVEIDIPDTPSTRPLASTDQASMAEIRDAAWEVLLRCVATGQRLGGFVQVGVRGALQVTVEAGDGGGMSGRGGGKERGRRVE
ncbi:MAG: hypothetical protein Q9184_000875 [Pyrenodesmia sp. 2 TL-2023]